ncbi:MAG: hypothetical protein ACP5T4_01480 [Candidatus Micrarchaeia archaeon]
MEKRKLLELLGSLFIAFIFLSSYAAFGGGPSGNQKTKATTTAARQFYGYGFANVSIVNYTNVFTLENFCNGSVANSINTTLQKFTNTGAVSDYYSLSPSSFSVEAGNVSAYSLLIYFSNITGSCAKYTATAKVQLPKAISFYFPSLSRSLNLTIPDSYRISSLSINFSRNTSKIPVTVMAFVWQNGTIANMKVNPG